MYDLLRSVAESKICVNAGNRIDVCELLCSTKMKIYCDSCRHEIVKKYDRERKAEKNEVSNEEKIRHKKERTRQLKKKITRKHNVILKMKKVVSRLQSKLENASAVMEGETGSLLHQLLDISRKKKFDPTKYNNYIKEVAVNIMYHSPGAYSYLRDTLKLPLPHRSTLMRVTQLLSGDCGFLSEVLLILKEYCARLPSNMRYVSLIWDEMSIKGCSFRYVKYADKILGLVDYGVYGSSLNTEDTSETADHALVFAVQSLSEKTFQPIGYFLTHGQAKAGALADIVKAGIRLVDETGLTTLALLCDAGTSNCAALKSLGLTTGGHQIEVEGKMRNVLFDPVHNFKCARNALLEKKNGRYTSAGKPLTVSFHSLISYISSYSFPTESF